MVNIKNETQKKALDGQILFDPHRLNSKFGKLDEVKTPDSFYFRYNIKDNHLYYTETSTDTIVLQSMNILDIKVRPNDLDECFMVFHINIRYKLGAWFAK